MAFTNNTRLPDAHTCASGGTHVSPPLAWSNPPAGTQSFAIIVRDPQVAGTTDNFHWAIYDIGGAARALPQGIPGGASITAPLTARQTTSSFGGAGYFYACPPMGTGTHNYTFVIHAISVATLASPPTDRSQIEAAVAGVSLGSTTLVGTYSR